ncbi:MAG: hypothetical protein ACLUOS_11675 [Odoribacter splanchnicus]
MIYQGTLTIGQYKTDDRISTFDIIDKHTFMLTQVPLPSSDENIIPSNFILMVDDNGDTIRSYFPLKFEHAPIMMQSCDCPFIYDEGVLVPGGHIGNDTMYMITAKEIHPFLITDFGKRGEIRKREFEGVDDVTFDDVYWPFYFGYYKDMLFSRLIYRRNDTQVSGKKINYSHSKKEVSHVIYPAGEASNCTKELFWEIN